MARVAKNSESAIDAHARDRERAAARRGDEANNSGTEDI
jgi:hypothetical protein